MSRFLTRIPRSVGVGSVNRTRPLTAPAKPSTRDARLRFVSESCSRVPPVGQRDPLRLKCPKRSLHRSPFWFGFITNNSLDAWLGVLAVLALYLLPLLGPRQSHRLLDLTYIGSGGNLLRRTFPHVTKGDNASWLL